jgi:transcriptional regulator with XRE-family HTH domain
MPDSTDPDLSLLRLNAIGRLIRQAREAAGRSERDVARFIGVPAKRLSDFEDARREPSLPELEAIAYFLDVPVTALVSDADAKLVRPRPAQDFKSLISLRTKIVGARLKQVREEKGETLKDAAEGLGLKPGQLTGFELGRRAVPITLLEKMIARYGVDVNDLLDLGIGQVGEAQLLARQRASLHAFDDEVRAFISDPASRLYLVLAMHLSKMPKEHLQGAARVLGMASAVEDA